MEARVAKGFAATGTTFPLRERSEVRAIVDHLLGQGMRKFEIAQCLDVPSHEFARWDRGTEALETLVRRRVNDLQAKHLRLFRRQQLMLNWDREISSGEEDSDSEYLY